ncbi:MAG TPA: diacylglycerol kinase [Usitatibacter sp.]|nr:diacylglycerol kinase [Usitatibacter sp.]
MKPDASEESPQLDIGPGRVAKALGYSIDGILAAWRTEAAFRQEALIAIVLVPVACLLPVPILHRALLAGGVLMVLMIELLNSSIEAAIDRISLDRHPLSKKSKDAGSAAVLFAVTIATLLWGAVLAAWLAGA